MGDWAQGSWWRGPCPLCAKHGDRDAAWINPDGYCGCWRTEHDWRELKYALGLDSALPARRPLAQPVSPRGKVWSAWAEEIWSGTQPLTGYDPISNYLKSRGCALPERSDDVRWQRAGQYPLSMVCKVTTVIDNKPTTLHFTELLPNGERKKIYLKGHRKEGVIRLFREDEVTAGLAVAEGIETALSVAHAYTPVWGCGDADNLKKFPWVPGIEVLGIYADADPAGINAAEECATRWEAMGADPWIYEPRIDGADYNDAVK